jgi:2-phosphosulfolactate phosphatase
MASARPDRTVTIDCFAESAARYLESHAIVVVDIIRASTMVVTAVAGGRRTVLAATPAEALDRKRQLGDAILAGEVRGTMPPGFDMNNSPVDLLDVEEPERPLVLVSTSGVELMLAAAPARAGAQVASLRNIAAVAADLEPHPGPIAIIGAGSRGEFRIEDQLGCAWIAERLAASGHRPADDRTADIIERWRGAPLAEIDRGHSVGYLRRTGQLRDRDFIVSHVDDIDLVCPIVGDEVHAQTEIPAEGAA